MTDFVVLSGCSGGGKSSLLNELGRRGHAIVEEPGRRIVRDELARGGAALPWVDAEAFLRRAVAMALDDRASASRASGYVFFDRGLVDAVAGLIRMHGASKFASLLETERYHPTVFLTPPWPEIYVSDSERPHGLDAAMLEYDHLRQFYPALGYTVVELPRISVSDRGDFVLAQLSR